MVGRTALMHANTPISPCPGETGNSVCAGSVVVPWGMCGLGFHHPGLAFALARLRSSGRTTQQASHPARLMDASSLFAAPSLLEIGTPSGD